MTLQTLPCFEHIRWQPDRVELRRFGIAMIVGFGILGGLAALRHHEVTRLSIALWGIGVGLSAVALIPGVGRSAYLAVYVPSTLVGWVVSRVLLALVFYLVFTPIGLLLRLGGRTC